MPNYNEKGIEITGIGSYYPERIVKNEEIVATMNSKGSAVDDEVLGKIEIKSRHWAAENEDETDLATSAVNEALKDAGVTADSIDLMVVSNWSARQFVPEIAPQIALQTGAKNAFAFNVCTACSGFLHAVQTAWMFLLSNRWKRAVVVSSDIFSRRVRPGSKGQLVTGDAAAAVVLERTENTESGLIDSVFHCDGSLKDITRVPPPEGWVKSQPELIDNAIQSNVYVVNQLLERNNLTMNDIDWVVPHPGTNPVHNGIKKELNIPDEKFMVNFQHRGNTGSASIPNALAEFYKNGTFKKGDLIISPGVGSGWYYGGILFRL